MYEVFIQNIKIGKYNEIKKEYIPIDEGIKKAEEKGLNLLKILKVPSKESEFFSSIIRNCKRFSGSDYGYHTNEIHLKKI